MNNKYYLSKLITNSQQQDSASTEVYTDKESALVAYHNILAAFHNADDVYYAVVMIINHYGNTEIMEIVNHIPAPEPTPEPEEET